MTKRVGILLNEKNCIIMTRIYFIEMLIEPYIERTRLY